jgi:hypothetical protein
VEFSAAQQVTVKLACHPPYHSKYNPVERVFGVLENYWNGDPLCTVSQALGMAEGMTYKGVHPQVTLIEGSYAKGVAAHQKTNETLRSLPGATDRAGQMVHHHHGRRRQPRLFNPRLLTDDLLLAESLTSQQVLEELPDLEMADIQACLQYASRKLNHPVLVPA